MKRFRLTALAAGVFFGFASIASAADMPTKSPMSMPVNPTFTWTGFYIGINGGGAWMDPSMTYTDLANTGNTSNSYVPSTVNGSASSVFAGLHAGYNWQAAPNWVLGIEGDWDWTNLKANGTNMLNRAVVGTLLTDNFSQETKVNWLASVRGRLGYASNNWLFYATGGVAFAEFDSNAQVNCTGVAPSLCGAPGQNIRASFSDTRVGAVVGGGIEFRSASNWTFGVEYLYYHFSSITGDGSWLFPSGAPAPFYDCTVAGQNCARFSTGDIGVNTARLRLSYEFNTPVVAKH